VDALASDGAPLGADEEAQGVLSRLARWAAWVELADIPERVTRLAASHVLSQLAAIRVGLQQEEGTRLVRALGRPLQKDAAQSARVLAGLGAWLNLDDTAYAGHLGPSTVAVPLAFAYAHRRCGAELLRAVVVANECAARVTASATLGPFRGQTALHTHVVGSVAGRLSCERADSDQWTHALALALSTPPWTLMRGFITSDARLLHVPVAVRLGLDACDAAAAGLLGAEDIIEHPDGFLAQFASVPLPEAVCAALGRRWHTDTLSFKMHPGGPGIDAAIDCAVDLHHAMGDWDPDDVEDIEIEGSVYTVFAARKAEPYLAGPRTPLGALVLTTAYPVATALLTGGLTVRDFRPPAIGQLVRWRLADRVRLVHNAPMTHQLLTGDAPVGEALRQAGPRAAPWLAQFGGGEFAALADAVAEPLEDFSQAIKPTPARVTVRLRGGRSFCRERTIPRGGAGPELRARHQALTAEKFIASGGPESVVEAWFDLLRQDGPSLARLIERSLAI
jgi:2-methylcitrate dehydratase PrpD